jgi:phage shock protein E
MSKFFKLLVASLIAIFAVSSLAACSSSESIDMSKVKSVIDVRTAGEYTTGHLEGAVNIDIQASDFGANVDVLDHAANYVVYCHSGNRAGTAISFMKDHGFTGNLTNAGGIDDASAATGLTIVQ